MVHKFLTRTLFPRWSFEAIVIPFPSATFPKAMGDEERTTEYIYELLGQFHKILQEEKVRGVGKSFANSN